MNRYKLIVNHNTDNSKYPQSQEISIIDLAQITASLGPLMI